MTSGTITLTQDQPKAEMSLLSPPMWQVWERTPNEDGRDLWRPSHGDGPVVVTWDAARGRADFWLASVDVAEVMVRVS